MSDDSFFAALVAEHYGISDGVLYGLPESSRAERCVYRIDHPDGHAWMLRAFLQDAALPAWLVGCGDPNVTNWLASRARTLAWLETCGYAAPRVVRTRRDTALAEHRGWAALLISYVPGEVTDVGLEPLIRLGTALARLHQVGVPDDPSSIGRSWFDTRFAAPGALAQLQAAADHVPDEWRTAHAAFVAAITTFAQHWALPQAVIHGDGWIGNLVVERSGRATLIDWDCAGLGVAVLDLARSLVYCHWGLHDPLPSHILPNTERITALVHGYCREHLPSRAEQDALADALRFCVAVPTAAHVARVCSEGWTEGLERLLNRRGNWLAACEAIAVVACSEIERLRNRTGLSNL